MGRVRGYYVRLDDGTVAHVRAGAKPTKQTITALSVLAAAINEIPVDEAAQARGAEFLRKIRGG